MGLSACRGTAHLTIRVIHPSILIDTQYFSATGTIGIVDLGIRVKQIQ